MSTKAYPANTRELSVPSKEVLTALAADTVFVNYTALAHFKDKAHRKAAQAYLSRNYGRKHRRIVIPRRGKNQPTKAVENDVQLESGLILHNVTHQTPKEVLSAGRIDPFNVYCVQDFPLFAHQMLDHGGFTFFPDDPLFLHCQSQSIQLPGGPAIDLRC